MKNKILDYNYSIIIIILLLLFISLMVYKLHKLDNGCDSKLNYQLEQSIENEHFLNNLIENQNSKIIYLNNTKDSLIKLNNDVNKKRGHRTVISLPIVSVAKAWSLSLDDILPDNPSAMPGR